MLVLISEKTRGKKLDKKKLKLYWKVVYPKKYTDVLVGKRELAKIKAAYKSKKEDVALKGVLQQNDKGFVFLDISNDVIHGLFTLIDEENIEKPPYFGKHKDGAHVSVISPDETKEKLKDTEIDEIGQEFHLKLKGFKSVNPEGWEEMERVWFVEFDAPELKKLRQKYGLPATYNGQGHEFHSSIAVRKAK
tara:strand:+ start:2139 stop:2711 length:573 start_codon:yes stop_codon:yes gene_type:complete